jgi:two-component system chemotaxis response regulator CheB
VVLDIEMPVMDGLTAPPRLLAVRPQVKVIIASTLTVENATISLKALAAGAADYIAKPTTAELGSAVNFQRELIEKVKALAASARSAEPAGAGRPSAAGGTARPARAASPARPIALRSPSSAPPLVLAIGSSTGGPPALFSLLEALKTGFALPVLIAQHMPATFTRILAEHLAKVSGRPASEAQDGQLVVSGRVYVAPGDFHMEVVRGADGVAIRLSKEPPENFCRPAVDPLFRSVAAAYGRNALGCILTGMGHDGCAGGRAITAAGGTIVAQDEATSVVWGMPGAAAAAGICSAVLPLGALAPHIRKLAQS